MSTKSTSVKSIPAICGFFLAILLTAESPASAASAASAASPTTPAAASAAPLPELAKPDFSKIAPHPRLFLTPSAKARILSEVASNPRAKTTHELIIKDAYSKLKAEPVKRGDRGFRMSGGGQAAERFGAWGYAWIMTGDKAFVERAKMELQALAKFEDWNPKHFLDTAAMATAFAIAYDRFYDAFDADTKKFIAGEIKKKAFAPMYSRRHGWFHTSRHVNNWSQVCGAGMLCAALAIYEEDPQLCAKVVEDSIKTLEKGTLDCFSEKGMYLEGSGYWIYGTTSHVMFVEALKSSFGNDLGFCKKYPQFLNSGKFILNMVGPSGLNFNFSDSGERIGGLSLQTYFAHATRDPSLMFWTYKAEGKSKANLNAHFREMFILMPDLAYEDAAPTENFWFDAASPVPVFLGRTGWNDDALFLGVKGGKAASSHGHMDAASFVFDALGERWAFDLGAQNYHSLEKLGMKIWSFRQNSDRWKVFRYNNHSHNILTINGELVNADADVKITGVRTGKDDFGATLDASGLYSPALRSAVRDISVVGGKKLRVIDRIENGERASAVRWNVCSWKDAKILDDTTIEVTSKKGKKMLVKLESPAGFKAKILSANPENGWDAKNPDRALLGFEGEVEPLAKVEIRVEMIPQK